MALTARILSLHRYPVKSMSGERLQSVELSAYGMAGDRLYAFESGDAPPGMLRVSAVQRRELLAHRAWTDERGAVQVLTPAGEQHQVDDAALLGERFLLTHAATPQTDVRPLSLMSSQTAEQLGREFGEALSAERFRSNILLDMSKGFAEDQLVGRMLRLGGAIVLIRERIPRCRFVTYNPFAPLTEAPAFALMKLLDRLHQGRVGVYATVLQPGRLQVGEQAELLDG